LNIIFLKKLKKIKLIKRKIYILSNIFIKTRSDIKRIFLNEVTNNTIKNCKKILFKKNKKFLFFIYILILYIFFNQYKQKRKYYFFKIFYNNFIIYLNTL